MRALAAAAAGALIAVAGLPGVPGSLPQARAEQPCTVKPGSALTGIPWAQRRLNFQRLWDITEGQNVTVAVIDTGLDTRHPQLAGMTVRPGNDVVDNLHTTRDCDGHGTAVTSIIAAQPSSSSAFVGVAPQATIVAIKQTNTQDDKSGNAETLARGIDAAVNAGAQVANVSVSVTNPTPQLRAAVQRAASVGLIIVAAAGNAAQNGNPTTYPAAYSTQFPNVIAVGATDSKDVAAPFSETGGYVDIAAPGAGVVAAAPVRGYVKLDGTSFAAPFVTGTVALLLAAHPDLTAAQVRDRLEATADAPPASVPNNRYGYGIVNPYLAVTAVRSGAGAPATRHAAAPLPPPVVPHPPSHHLEHVALAVAAILLALVVLVLVAAAVLRGARIGRRRAAPAP